MITVKELREILALVPDDQPIYVPDENGDGCTVKSYTIFRYDDGIIELTLYSHEMCGLDL